MFDYRAGCPHILVREMSANRADVLRAIEAAFPGQVHGQADRIEIGDNGRMLLEIELRDGAVRRHGALALGTLTATFRFAPACDAATRRAWMQRLDRCLQRGGG